MIRAFFRIAFGVLAVVSAGVLWAQPSYLGPSVSIDAVTSYYDDVDVYWELFYSFPDTAMTYVQKDGRYIGEIYMSISIASASKTVAEQEWVISHQSDSPVVQYQQNLLGTKAFRLAPGHYTATMTVADMQHAEQPIEREFPLIIKPFPKGRISISDIEFASVLKRVASVPDPDAINPLFIKNTLVVMPNPELEFAGENPSLKFYAEVYNAQKFAPAGFGVRYTITDAYKKVMFSQYKTRASKGDFLVEAASIALDTLASGLYYFKATVLNDTLRPTDSSSSVKKFFVLNPNRPPVSQALFTENELFELSEFATMSSERIEDEYAKSLIIATSQEEALYNSLTEDLARQKFLFQFWLARDHNIHTLVNERRQDYLERIEYANSNYSNLQVSKGWRTDQGRVLLKYGKPTNIDQRIFDVDTRPYEVWSYTQLQGGVEFVFVDLNGFGNYQLVHSTAQNEVRFESWFDRYVNVVEVNQPNLDAENPIR